MPLAWPPSRTCSSCSSFVAKSSSYVDRGEVLEDADGVVRAEHRDRAGEPDPLGARGGRGERDGGGGDDEVASPEAASASTKEQSPSSMHSLQQMLARATIVGSRVP